MSNKNNVFAIEKQQQKSIQGAPAATDEARAIQEVQASLIIAKKFPRNQIEAMDRILMACTRPTLAEGALYTYSRGGTAISGPSIRLAEAIAQAWGNISFGIRELSTEKGTSTIEAYAWDLETNTRQSKVFSVPHRRHTRKGGYDLTDPRDIYETIANNGARRMRACILGVIPGDVTEAAVKQCAETLRTNVDTSPDAIKKMTKAFEPFGVKKEHIEKRIQCRIEAIRPAQVIAMGKIYNSLKDGMSTPADWFDMETPVNDLNDKFSGHADKDTKSDEAKGARTRPKVIKSFKDEIDSIETAEKLDTWRYKHKNRVARDLPKESDQQEVYQYAQDRYERLKAVAERPVPDPPEDQAREFHTCPAGKGNVPESYCNGECSSRQGCPEFPEPDGQG